MVNTALAGRSAGQESAAWRSDADRVILRKVALFKKESYIHAYQQYVFSPEFLELCSLSASFVLRGSGIIFPK